MGLRPTNSDENPLEVSQGGRRSRLRRSPAVALDSEDWPEVVGTLAGDDTILVIAADNATAEQVRKRCLEPIEER